MAKTINEINEKIRTGSVVVVTAEEVIDLVEKNGSEETARIQSSSAFSRSPITV